MHRYHHAAGSSGSSRVLSSVQLSLMIGPIIPLTVPREALDALVSVEVKVEDVGTSGFQLVFSIDKQSPLQILFLLSGGVAAAVHARSDCGHRQRREQRADRRRHHQQPDLARRQRLQLYPDDYRQGPDRTNEPVELERLPLSRPVRRRPGSPCSWSNMRCSASFRSSSRASLPISRSRSTAFPARRARTWNTYGTWQMRRAMSSTSMPGPAIGTSTAYWGPQIKVGPVQPALSVDMDAYTNVESLHFNFDQEKNKIPDRVHLCSAGRSYHSDPDSADYPAESAPRDLFRRCPRTYLATCSQSATTSPSGPSRRPS